jgi:S-DNA-T family DNA segregation ATPase FtsK/SpoIIIE
MGMYDAGEFTELSAMTVASRRTLDMQADRIDMIFAAHKVGARVWGGAVAPRCVTFDVSAGWDTRVRQVANLAEEIALALGAPGCRVYRQGAAIKIEVPQSSGSRVGLLDLCRQARQAPAVSAVLGVGRDGRPLLARLASPDVVHVLVSGTTGSGKTEALRAIVASLAVLNRQSVCQLLLIDPKGRGLAPFAGLPHLLRPPVSSVGEATEALQALVTEMERRDAAGAAWPHIVVVIDELADLLMQGGPELESALARLVQRGRSAGLHVAAATQKPAASVIGSLIRSNFPLRIVGRVCSAQDALVAAGVAGSNAEKLLGRGDMLAILGSQMQRFQGATIGESDIRDLARDMRRV